MDNLDNLERQFRRMGARVVVTEATAREHDRKSPAQRQHHRWTDWWPTNPFSINVRTDEKGEHFTLHVGDNSMIPKEVIVDEGRELTEIRVLDVQPKDRHLVLRVVLGEGRNKQVDHLLCGHDERHWFVVRSSEKVTTVCEAKEALKPAAVSARQKRLKIKRSKRNKRKNEAFLRQGEWFFLPAPDFDPERGIISRKEPLQRGRGKPHLAEECCRVGGRTVMVNSRFAPNGISMAAYNRLRQDKSREREVKRSGSWYARTADARVFVRGAIRHPDHKTLKLKVWHEVVPNTEQVRTRQGHLTTVAFLD